MRAWKPWMTAGLGLATGLALIALLPGTALFVDPVLAEAEQAATGERYACPMMDFIGTKPGRCPVCGMEMTRVTAGELSAEQTRRIGLQTSIVKHGPAVATVSLAGSVLTSSAPQSPGTKYRSSRNGCSGANAPSRPRTHT